MSQVDLLIGLDASALHASLEERTSHEGGPIARKTLLGWMAFGKVSSSSSAFSQCLLVRQDTTSSVDPLTTIVKRFWELESVGMEPQNTSYMLLNEQSAEKSSSCS